MAKAAATVNQGQQARAASDIPFIKTHWHTIFQDWKCIQRAITIIVHFWLPFSVIQVILASLYAKAEGEGLGNLITSFVARPWYVITYILSTAKWYTRPILHSVLATKMGQAPAERLSVWNMTRLSDKRENSKQWCNIPRGAKRRHYLGLHCSYFSHPSATKIWT